MKYSISLEEKINHEKYSNIKIMREKLDKISKIKLNAIVISVVLIIMNIVFSIILPKITGFTGFLTFLAILTSFIAYYIEDKNNIKFKESFKLDIVPYLLVSIDRSIRYLPNGVIGVAKIKNSGLDFAFDKLTGEDYIAVERRAGKTSYNLEISEIHTSFSDEKLNIIEQKIKGSFDGVFAVAKAKCSYPGSIKIIHNQMPLDKISKKMLAKTPKISLEYSSFESIYDVYATEQINVRRLLTPSTMSLLERIANDLKIVTEISIEKNNIYLKLEYKDFLDFYSNGNVIDKEKLEKDNQMLISLFNLIDELVINVEKISIE